MNNPITPQSIATLLMGGRPHTVVLTRQGRTTTATISYQDFLPEARLLALLRESAPLPGVVWQVERTMSTEARATLLAELYDHPHILHADTAMQANVRRYVLDRFTGTDFS